MKRDLHCPYSILDNDLICEHKLNRVVIPSTATLHNHDGFEIVVYLKGDVQIFVESEAKQMERGDIFLIPTFSFHGLNTFDVENYERIVLNIRPNLLQELSDKHTDLSSCFYNIKPGKLNYLHVDDSYLDELVSLLDKLEKVSRSSQYGSSILAKAYLAEFMVAISNYAHHSEAPSFESIMSPAIAKVFAYVDENLCNNITVEKIADDLHHNSDYLGRLFHEVTGGSLKYYINAKKISLAQKYLCEGYSPYDVCFMIGYNNYTSFSRRFSSHIGCSPKQYQQKWRKSQSTIQ